MSTLLRLYTASIMKKVGRNMWLSASVYIVMAAESVLDSISDSVHSAEILAGADIAEVMECHCLLLPLGRQAIILKTAFSILQTVAEAQTSVFPILAAATPAVLPTVGRQVVPFIQSVTPAMEQESASAVTERVENGRISAVIRVPTPRSGVTACRATALGSVPSATAEESFDSQCCSAIPVFWIR